MMWLFLSDAFLSIVAPAADGPEDCLVVRARVRGDIKRLFPGAEVIVDGGTDYQFRAFIPREEVMRAVARRVAAIGYANFKDAVRDDHRHDVYLRVWAAAQALSSRGLGRSMGRRRTLRSFGEARAR